MKRVPVELQSTATECGLVCLAMVAAWHLPGTDLMQIRRRWQSPKRGLTLHDISQLAEELGLASRGLRCELEDLKVLRKPCILHWDLEHFVVLVASTRRACVIHDPATGRQRLSWAEASRHFTGVALELWPGAQPRVQVQPPARLRLTDLLSMTRSEVGTAIWVLLLSALLQACVLALPWHMQWTVDEAIVAGDVHLLAVLAVAFGLLLLVRVAANWVRGLLVIYLGHALSFQLACRLLQHLLRLPLDWFEQRSVGDVQSRFAALEPVRELFTQGFAMLLVDIVMVLLAVLAMLTYHPTAALAIVAVHVLVALVGWLLGTRLRRLSLSTVVAQAHEQAHLLESIRGIFHVKAYDQGAVRLAQWQKLHGHTLRHSMALQRSQLLLATLMQAVGGVELLLMVYVLAQEVVQGLLTVGMLFAFVSYRGHFVERAHAVVERLLGLKTLSVHLRRLAEIWCEPVPRGPAGSGVQSDEPRLLQARSLDYRHGPRDAWVLRHLSVSIAPGEFVAIVGMSGSGKSTLLKLLMGLLPPSAGEITLGGAPMDGQANADARARMACVMGAEGLFSGSVLDNLTLWQAPDVERARQALEAVDLWQSLSSLPMGVHTPVGEIGAGLSSGQIQRLLLARALYREADYLFVDEGTANLDGVSAQVVCAVLQHLRCTRVVVTHDPLLAEHADRVLVLRDGRLSEMGSPAAADLKSAAVRSAGL